jgi:hypothetical protein
VGVEHLSPRQFFARTSKTLVLFSAQSVTVVEVNLAPFGVSKRQDNKEIFRPKIYVNNHLNQKMPFNEILQVIQQMLDRETVSKTVASG